MNMRILCLTPWFPLFPGAHEGSFILDSVNALEAEGATVKVLVSQVWYPQLAGYLQKEWETKSWELESHESSLALQLIHYLSIPRNYCRALAIRLYLWRVVPALLNAIEEFQPQVILAHTEQAGMAAAAAGKRAKVPVAVVVHGVNTSARLNTAREKWRVKAMLEQVNSVFFVGHSLAQYFKSVHGDLPHAVVIPNGFTLPVTEKQRTISPWGDIIRFISVGNLVPGKGHELNLRALAEMNRHGHHNWSYTIVGDGSEREYLETLVLELKLLDQVMFVGAVAHRNVYHWLKQADVFLLPSWREAFGIAWLEAQACGLLTIAVQGQGPTAFIEHGITGLLVKPQDSDDLVRCLQKIFTEPQKMQQLAKQGKASAWRHHGWHVHAQQLLQALNTMTVRHG